MVMCSIACKGHTFLQVLGYLKGAVWCRSVQYAHAGVCIRVYTVCSYMVTIHIKIKERILPRGVFGFAEANGVRVTILHLRCIILPTQVAPYSNAGWKWEHTIVLQCTCTLYTFPQFGWDSRSLGKWKKVPHVWTKIGLYIPMGPAECFRFPKHWTSFSVKTSADARPSPSSQFGIHALWGWGRA